MNKPTSVDDILNSPFENYFKGSLLKKLHKIKDFGAEYRTVRELLDWFATRVLHTNMRIRSPFYCRRYVGFKTFEQIRVTLIALGLGYADHDFFKLGSKKYQFHYFMKKYSLGKQETWNFLRVAIKEKLLPGVYYD